MVIRDSRFEPAHLGFGIFHGCIGCGHGRLGFLTRADVDEARYRGLHDGNDRLVGGHLIAHMTGYCSLSARVGDPQDFPGDGGRDRVDMPHLGLPVVVGRHLHRPFAHGGKVNCNRPGPSKPYEAGHAEPQNENPRQPFS